MTRLIAILLAALAATAVGVASAGAGGSQPRVGVIVDTTAGADPAALRAARAEARRLGAELRVTRSPSESVAAAATLVTRGAETLVVHGDGGEAVSGPLRRSRPDVRVVLR